MAAFESNYFTVNFSVIKKDVNLIAFFFPTYTNDETMRFEQRKINFHRGLHHQRVAGACFTCASHASWNGRLWTMSTPVMTATQTEHPSPCQLYRYYSTSFPTFFDELTILQTLCKS